MAPCSAGFLFSLPSKRNGKATKSKMKITKDIFIEDLISELPESVEYLMNRGIRCLRCGEPVWGTLENAAKEKEFSAEQIEVFVSELNVLRKKNEG